MAEVTIKSIAGEIIETYEFNESITIKEIKIKLWHILISVSIPLMKLMHLNDSNELTDDYIINTTSELSLVLMTTDYLTEPVRYSNVCSRHSTNPDMYLKTPSICINYSHVEYSDSLYNIKNNKLFTCRSCGYKEDTCETPGYLINFLMRKYRVNRIIPEEVMQKSTKKEWLHYLELLDAYDSFSYYQIEHAGIKSSRWYHISIKNTDDGIVVIIPDFPYDYKYHAGDVSSIKCALYALVQTCGIDKMHLYYNDIEMEDDESVLKNIELKLLCDDNGLYEYNLTCYNCEKEYKKKEIMNIEKDELHTCDSCGSMLYSREAIHPCGFHLYTEERVPTLFMHKTPYATWIKYIRLL